MSSSTEPLRPIKVFYSYAHQSRRDTSLKCDLVKHLSNLRHLGEIKGWSADDINAGMDEEQETLTNLDNANIILILISPDYMASDYHHNFEMRRAIDRRKANKSYILFVLLRKTDIEEAVFSEYEDYYYPSNHKPVTSWPNRDEAFNDIAIGVRKVVQEFREIDKTLKTGQISSKPTPAPINRLSTPINAQTRPTTTTGNKASRKRTNQLDSQIDAQIAEPASPQVAWDKKPLPKSRNRPIVNTSQVSKGLTSSDVSMFWRKFFSSKEFKKCSGRKGNSDLLFFLFVLLDIVIPTLWLGDALVVLKLSWLITFVIVLLLFIWGVYNIFLPFAITLSFLFGGAWALIVSHYQGWSGTPLYIIIGSFWIFNFFLFRSHSKAGIFTFP